MGKIRVAMYVTLDGVMEDPSWTAPYWNDEIAKFQLDLLFASDALLLGRITYEEFAAAWPSATDEEGFADKMNSIPKYVVTATLKEAEWNAQFIKGNITEEIEKLKATDQNLLVYGSGELIEALMEEKLIDEFHLMVFPIVVGSGKQLFKEGIEQTELELAESSTTETGVVISSYVPE
ncbi:dihydrofolate reductase family protein [Planococcus salinus]|uniref:Dihydrofolate reductase n=1 Tax=Planococcus salinus TaxID=1848460 RepID=A0A3M8P895_9BACL|nr:dihydrofolate reductase family protein [Planococcus salinus]RNF39883.1 dihydrofolate reductase [Planococcus salinus]